MPPLGSVWADPARCAGFLNKVLSLPAYRFSLSAMAYVDLQVLNCLNPGDNVLKPMYL